MILTKAEKESLKKSFKSLGFRGHLYLLRGASFNPAENKKKLLFHFRSSLADNIEKDWKTTRASSWSHTANIVGIWIGSHNYKVGLDIEDNGRINTKLLKRIQNPLDDVSPSTPESHFFWGVKESAFKALSLNPSLKTISQIQIQSFKPINSLLKQHLAVVKNSKGHDDTRVFCFQKDGFNFCIAQSLSDGLNP
jgi:hypothetical protein